MGSASLVRALAVGGVLVLASCHRGGGGRAGDVRFVFQDAALSTSESDAPAGVTVVLRTSPPVLSSDVSVEVFDLGTGTATAGSDYAAFAPVKITFPAGSADGATAVVLLDPSDDDVVDAPGETIELGLRNPVGGLLEGTTQLTITLADADEARVGFATAAGSSSEGEGGQVALELECGAGV